MRILNNKKATAVISNFPFWMFYVVAVSITSIVIVYIGTSFVAKAAEIPPNMEDELTLASRFYNSGTVHPRLIDFNKFNQETMSRCFPESNVKYAFLLSLKIPKLQNTENFSIPDVETYNWEKDYLATKKMSQDIMVLYNNAI